MRARMMPRQGDITINPTTGEIVKAGSDGFNLSMVEGFADRIYFKTPGEKSAFADFDVNKKAYNKSDKIIKKCKVSQKALDATVLFVSQYVALLKLQTYIGKLPKGKN